MTQLGGRIIRVHNVKETQELVKTYQLFQDILN